MQFNPVQPHVHFFPASLPLLPGCDSLDNMASTSNIPLADFTRHYGGHDLPVPAGQPQNSISRDIIAVDPRDPEDAWHPEQQVPADIGEREQVHLPSADGGREAWLFLCGCFTIEALVWGMFEYLIFA